MTDYIRNIQNSKITIYDKIDTSDTDLFIPTHLLEEYLNTAMVGFSLSGLALRTRAKVVKARICEALGYPVPTSFAKTQPRFPGQNFDVFTQKSLNVQIWNEDIDMQRRYVFLRVSDEDIITKVRIITGEVLASYDNTGTLTHKYQATMSSRGESVLFSVKDTDNVDYWITEGQPNLVEVNPNSKPQKDQLLRIATIYSKLLPLVGKSVEYLDAVQERNRGAELHKLICEHLGYTVFEDDGTYPDLANQLLEIKLQTSPTIDLGLHSPNDGNTVVTSADKTFNSEDVRYVIFDGEVHDETILLNYLYLVNGKDFSKHFPLFKGKGTNAKLQIPLPPDFFD